MAEKTLKKWITYRDCFCRGRFYSAGEIHEATEAPSEAFSEYHGDSALTGRAIFDPTASLAGLSHINKVNQGLSVTNL